MNKNINFATAVPDIKVGDVTHNTQKHIEIINKMEKERVNILAFPELSLTGATCGDLFFQEPLYNAVDKGIEEIAKATEGKKIIVIFGAPIRKNILNYNVAIIVQNGEVIAIIPKTQISKSLDIPETRWFTIQDKISFTYKMQSGREVIVRSQQYFKIKGTQKLVQIIIGDEYVKQETNINSNIKIHISATYETLRKSNERTDILEKYVKDSFYVYVSAGPSESTTDYVFSGYSAFLCYKSGNNFIQDHKSIFTRPESNYEIINKDTYICVFDENCEVEFEVMEPYENPSYFSVNNYTFMVKSKNPYFNKSEWLNSFLMDNAFIMQTYGLMGRIRHIGTDKVIIAVSGGLDSTLALLVCVNAFDKLKIDRKNIIAITMPGFGTSEKTYKNSYRLMESLGVTTKEISIVEACRQHFKDIGHDENEHDVTFENAQARERTQIAMDIANKENAIMVGPADLSELALGFTTYNGDHMSMYAVNSGIPKTAIIQIVDRISDKTENEELKNVLTDILDTKVSPELLPVGEDGQIVQETENIMGPYDLNDYFLFNIMQNKLSPKEIYENACFLFEDDYSNEEILSWLKKFYKRFVTQQFKRSCMPDGPKIFDISLSPRTGFVFPSDASYSIFLEELESIE